MNSTRNTSKYPIQTENLSFIYKSSTIHALKSINIKIKKGTFVILAGPTGSGKTTLIRSINGLIPHFYQGHFYGYMHINGKDSLEENPASIALSVGTVFQSPENQLFSMDVEQELAFGLGNLGFSKENIRSAIEHVFHLMHIEHLRHRAPYELSGGEQQKVAIAATLALNPNVLVLDEPLANLDPKTAIEMVALLNRLHLEENKTILISEHRLEYLIPYAEEILLIENGKLLAHDAIQELLNQDKIYESRIDLPPILQWFKDQKKQGNFLDDIPFKFKDQVKILKAILEKLPNSKSQIKLQSDTLSAIQPEYQPDIQSEPLIDCQNISFNYSTNSRIKSINYIIDDISFSAQKGEILGIIGPNGAGKSTLIRCLNGLNKPISGKIWLKNEDTNLKPVYELAKDVGIIFQNPDHQLFANSVEEELKFSLKNLSISEEEVKQRISETLSNFKLKDFRKISPFNMSGGQKKRVSLASIACRKTSVIIFDEPTVGQDAAQKAKLRDFILKNQQIGHTIIIISHDLEFLASIVSRIIVLIKGKIFTEGLPHKILQDQDILQRASLKEPIIGKLLNEIRPDLPFIPEDILTIEEFQEWIASCQ